VKVTCASISMAVTLLALAACGSSESPSMADAAPDRGSPDRLSSDLPSAADLVGDTRAYHDAPAAKWSQVWAGSAYLRLWAAPTELFGAGLDYDGSQWSAVAFTYSKGTPKLTALDQSTGVTQFTSIGGNSASDVYIAGGPGLYHYDGQSWTACAAEGLNDYPWIVAGAGGGKVWVGVNDTLFAGDCSSLSKIASFSGDTIFSIASTSTHVYVGTFKSVRFMSLPGGSWQKVATPAGSWKFKVVLVQDAALALAKSSASSEVDSLLKSSLGDTTMSQVFKVNAGRGLSGIAGTSQNDLYVCGSHNTLRHFDGTSWTDLPFPTLGTDYANAVAIALLAGAPALLVWPKGAFYNDSRLYLLAK